VRITYSCQERVSTAPIHAEAPSVLLWKSCHRGSTSNQHSCIMWEDWYQRRGADEREGACVIAEWTKLGNWEKRVRSLIQYAREAEYPWNITRVLVRKCVTKPSGLCRRVNQNSYSLFSDRRIVLDYIQSESYIWSIWKRDIIYRSW
jgi:hypothetical protein